MGVDSTVQLMLVFLANVGAGMVDEGGSLVCMGIERKKVTPMEPRRCMMYELICRGN
jgi:hypothetical protein